MFENKFYEEAVPNTVTISKLKLSKLNLYFFSFQGKKPCEATLGIRA